LQDLRLTLPANINVLGVSGPSLRNYEVVAIEDDPAADSQVIELQFTREMEGQFRIDVAYERIMDRDAPETEVPTLSVEAAEVEHGRIAIEALTAVEVRAGTVEQLSSLDINEPPQQLVLKTTNPILLAYRYVNAQPPIKLGLKITRHREIGVQVAAIERADYKTLITRDGLAVTTARLTVRNSRRQFLRRALPPQSQVWSVFVDGKPEKPAFATDGADADGSAVLVKMINSARGFPVDIVYATPAAKVDHLGTISSRLPRPDMVVTHTSWNVFLPVGPHYLTPDSTMDTVVNGTWANPRTAGGEAVTRVSKAYQDQFGQPLRITVPSQGIRFAFEKLYANQSGQEAWFELPYASPSGVILGHSISLAGTLLFWLGIGLYLLRTARGVVALGTSASGLVLLVVAVGVYHVSARPMLWVSLVGLLAAAAFFGRRYLPSTREMQTLDEA